MHGCPTAHLRVRVCYVENFSQVFPAPKPADEALHCQCECGKMQVSAESGLHDEQILKHGRGEKNETGLKDDAREPEGLAFWDQVEEGQGWALVLRMHLAV